MTLYHPPREDLDISAVLHALSDPQRLRIVQRLHATGQASSCGAFDLEITKSTLTHHFRVLREAGLITQEIVGTSKLNSLRRADIDARFPGLLDAVLSASSAHHAAAGERPSASQGGERVGFGHGVGSGAVPAGQGGVAPA